MTGAQILACGRKKMKLQESLALMEKVYNDYAGERRRQLRKHPDDTLNNASLGDALHIAGEEFGEAIRAYVNYTFHDTSLREILKELIEAGTSITVLAARIQAQLDEQAKQQELPLPASPQSAWAADEHHSGSWYQGEPVGTECFGGSDDGTHAVRDSYYQPMVNRRKHSATEVSLMHCSDCGWCSDNGHSPDCPRNSINRPA